MVGFFWDIINVIVIMVSENDGAPLFAGRTSSSSVTVQPTVTTAYQLTAEGSGGTATATATIEVRGTPPIVVSFSAEPVEIFATDFDGTWLYGAGIGVAPARATGQEDLAPDLLTLGTSTL